MKLVEVNWNPTDRQLRQFGLITLVAFPLLGWLWGHPSGAMASLTRTGLRAAAPGLISPRSLKYGFIGLSLAPLPIGIVMSEVSLLLTFSIVFVPLGIGFRLLGRDVLKRRLEPAA